MKSVSKKYCFVFGTRPEIIKLAPIVKECQLKQIPFITIHTGQHYDQNMDQIFWNELQLPDPSYNLHIGSGSHAEQIGQMLEKIEKILIAETPDLVIVQGDTNSALSGAIAAAKLNIPIAHVEAGLRSFDRTMPEEINRIIADHVSTWNFAPTKKAEINLINEGIPRAKIHLTGNTIVDALTQNRSIAEQKSTISKKILSQESKYVLLTIHRPSNTDSKDNLKHILQAIEEVSVKRGLLFIWPIHPRTKNKLIEFQLHEHLTNIQNLKVISPVGYLDMIWLLDNSQLVITDSGGLQEEACVLKIPCVTLRDNTERPESVDVGANILVKNGSNSIIKAVDFMLKSKKDWDNPYGDGLATKRIISILENH